MAGTDAFIVLGAGTLDFLPDRGPSAHLLRAGGAHALVDSGPGAIGRLAERGLDSADLGAIVHSHRHLDHLADLFPMLMHRALAHPAAPLLLAGAPGHEAFVRTACEALWGRLLVGPVSFLEQEPDGLAAPLLPSVALRAFPADHSQAPRLLRFEGPDWSLCYTGDTGPEGALEAAAAGVDWLVVECTAPDGVPRGRHLAPARIAAAIQAVRPKAVCLVHLSPAWERPDDAAGSVRALVGRGGPPVVAARDGTELPLPYSHSMVPGGLLETS